MASPSQRASRPTQYACALITSRLCRWRAGCVCVCVCACVCVLCVCVCVCVSSLTRYQNLATSTRRVGRTVLAQYTLSLSLSRAHTHTHTHRSHFSCRTRRHSGAITIRIPCSEASSLPDQRFTDPGARLSVCLSVGRPVLQSGAGEGLST